jgi:hypothetical protein
MCKRFLVRVVLAGVAFGSQIVLADPVDARLSAKPNANQLMAQSVKVTERNWAQAPEYSFTRTEINSKGASKLVRKTDEVLMINGSPYSKLIALDGRPLTAQQAREQEQKLRQEVAKRAAESPRQRRWRIGKYNEERNHDHQILLELTNAFNYTVLGEQRINGRDAWILHGILKPGYVPKNREGRVLTGMDVKFWIDKETLQWPRVEAEVQKPVTMYVVGTVHPGTRFVLEQEVVSATLWLPKTFRIQVKATAFGFLNRDSSSEETYANYRLAQEGSTKRTASLGTDAKPAK